MSTVPSSRPPDEPSGESASDTHETGAQGVDAQVVDRNVPPVAPLDVDGVSVATWGTVAWAVAGLIGLLFFRDQLSQSGRSWWLLVCAAGFAIGMGFSVYTRRRRAVYAQARQVRRTPSTDDPTESGS